MDINHKSEFFEETASDADILKDIKASFRLLKQKLNKIKRKILHNSFTKILIITSRDIPFDYIQTLKKQYPDKDFSVLTPLIGEIPNGSKNLFEYEFFLQNKNNYSTLYKLPKNTHNISVYSIYSETFSKDIEKYNFLNLKQICPFLKSARFFVEKIKPNIVHVIDLPYFLGVDFEKKYKKNYKVLEQITDFSKYDNFEPFWTALNIINKEGMKKLCRDKIIQKCVATLFNLHNTKNFYQMHDCLEFIYENYLKFRSSIDRDEEVDENILFKRLNARTLKLFPQLKIKDCDLSNIMHKSLKKCNFWIVLSKTYYDAIFEDKTIAGCLYQEITDTKTKSDFVSFGTDFTEGSIHETFTEENFREKRVENKKYLLKELSEGRILTKFTDESLFTNEDYKIYGYLDAFYDAPLIFCCFKSDVKSEGIDIAFSSILKLFEQRKNIRVIFNIPDGMKNDYIKKFVNFCKSTPAINGRWIFIDGYINLSQFYASSDIALFPYRNPISSNLPLLAINFGCVPITSGVGILNDIITNIFDDMTEGCGFKISESLNSENADDIYLKTLSKGLNFYSQNTSWNIIVKNCLTYNTKWNFQTIEKYNKIYEEI